MSELRTHLRLAARRLAQTPGLSAIAVTTLALALGAHVAIFGLLRTLFLEAPPVLEPQRLVTVHESRHGTGHHPLSFPDYLAYRDQSRVFRQLAAQYEGAPLDLRRDGDSIPISGAVASADLFAVLGFEPRLGRFFSPEEDAEPGRLPVAVISEQLWRDRLDADAGAVGSTLWLNGTAFTVIGVAPAAARRLRLAAPVDVWIPTSMAAVGYRWCDARDPDCTWLDLVGRLAPGRSIDDARAELALIARRLHPELDLGGVPVRGVHLAPLSVLHPDERATALRLGAILLGAVSLLILIAGTSLSGLLLARALGRRREVAVRLALGASRGQIVGLFVAETLLLALAGGFGGLWTATWFARLVARLYGNREPVEIGSGPTTVVYAVALSVLVGVAVGLVPALHATRRGLIHGLGGSSARGHAAGQRSTTDLTLRRLLVVQVALSMVLLTAAGLLARAVDTVSRAGAADPERVATLRLRPRLVGMEAGRAQAFTREVVRRISELPEVRSVSLAVQLPPGRGNDADVRARAGADRPMRAATQAIAPRFFETLGLPLLEGRELDARDDLASSRVAIVNRALARSLWPDGPAVGRTLEAFGARHRVVGVVDDSPLHLDPPGAPVPQLYTAYWQDAEQVDARLIVATTTPAARSLPRLREVVGSVDATVPVTETGDYSQRLRATFAKVGLTARVLAISTALSLLLCALFVHGLCTLLATRRRRELAIRRALGASRSQVVAVAMSGTLSSLALGLAAGLALALGVTRLLESTLYTVSATDPATFAAAALVLSLVGAAACWWPAERASRDELAAALGES